MLRCAFWGKDKFGDPGRTIKAEEFHDLIFQIPLALLLFLRSKLHQYRLASFLLDGPLQPCKYYQF